MPLDDLLAALEPVSLDELDHRASLQNRTDQKYLVPVDAFERVAAQAQGRHVVLEIDGDRTFSYRSVYFDTPELDAFCDHLAGNRPRYKVRTRHYVDTGTCHFEVKVKGDDDRTAKEHLDHDPADAARLTDEARGLIDRVLRGAGADPPHELRPTLVTEFRRSTIAASDAPERSTIDSEVRLSTPEGPAVRLRDECVLVETKTRDGDGALDRLFADAGCESLSLSKYRLGVAMLLRTDVDREYAEPFERIFERLA